MTAKILDFCSSDRWTCKCLDCKLFRSSYRRQYRKGERIGRKGHELEMNEYGDVLSSMVDEVVVWRLMRGIPVPATGVERSYAAWFLLKAGEIDRPEIAARVGITTRTVDRLIIEMTKGYVCPLVKSYWFAGAVQVAA